MFTMIKDSLKLQKVNIENNEYMILLNWSETDTFKNNKILTRGNGEKRFCKASKTGNITINLYGNKIKENINNIPDWQ